MRVSRSLTIKQMAAVSGVVIITICIFIIIQLFHFVQQRKTDSARQMENIAHSVRQPLADAVLRADVIQAEKILSSLKSSGILSRADVVLPNAFQALHVSNGPEKPVPRFAARLFELPVQISVPLYATGHTVSPKPLAYLVLQADSWPVYQFILNTISTMLTTWLLMALILSVALSWCINRLIIHPLRYIAQDIQSVTSDKVTEHRLTLSRLHQDDEIGLLVRSYNRNQQILQSMYEQMRAGHLVKHHGYHFQPESSAVPVFESKRPDWESERPVEIREFSLSPGMQSQVNMKNGEVTGIELINRPVKLEKQKNVLEWSHYPVSEKRCLEELIKQLRYYQQRLKATMTITIDLPGKMPDLLILLGNFMGEIERNNIKKDRIFIKIEWRVISQHQELIDKLMQSDMRVEINHFIPNYTNIDKLLHYKLRPGSRINIEGGSALKMDKKDLIFLNEIINKLKFTGIACNVTTVEQRDKFLQCGIVTGQGMLFD